MCQIINKYFNCIIINNQLSNYAIHLLIMFLNGIFRLIKHNVSIHQDDSAELLTTAFRLRTKLKL